MFHFLAFNSGPVISGNVVSISCYRYRFCVWRLIPVMFTGVCMAHWITCLIPTCKSTCGRNNTKTTFLEIFFIGYHFITARKVSSAISSLNVCEKTFDIDISLPERPEFNARKWNIASSLRFRFCFANPSRSRFKSLLLMV